MFILVISLVSGEKKISRHFNDVEGKFIDYIVQFNKSYRSNVDEYRRRFITFQVRFFHIFDKSFVSSSHVYYEKKLLTRHQWK